MNLNAIEDQIFDTLVELEHKNELQRKLDQATEMINSLQQSLRKISFFFTPDDVAEVRPIKDDQDKVLFYDFLTRKIRYKTKDKLATNLQECNYKVRLAMVPYIPLLLEELKKYR